MTNNLAEVETLDAWTAECKVRNLEIKRRSGSGEDPFTHYSAYNRNTNLRVGYFGDANGADADFGVIADNHVTLLNWMGY